MPQMAPINWIFLYLLFILIFMMFNFSNYYYYFFSLKNNFKLNYFKKNKSWKW
uniref:ATP synthase complex subunit 8 n=1 Tax=Pselaphinae sp. 4 EF-2015 TaxID=1756858 RepID=A0A0S2M8I5_9COLE|nr:ATP synthase F0 subunit 8 [Pselaphinae sp. 4 EF-2015]